MYLEFKVLCDTWANSIINLFTYKLEIYIYIYKYIYHFAVFNKIDQKSSMQP